MHSNAAAAAAAALLQQSQQQQQQQQNAGGNQMGQIENSAESSDFSGSACSLGFSIN